MSGVSVLQKRGERRDPRAAREQHDISAAVDDEVAVRHLDPDLPALDQLALHARGEPAVHRVGDPDARPARAGGLAIENTRDSGQKPLGSYGSSARCRNCPARNRGTGRSGRSATVYTRSP